MDDYAFEYDDHARTILKRFGTDESAVEMKEVIEYCGENTHIEDGDR